MSCSVTMPPMIARPPRLRIDLGGGPLGDEKIARYRRYLGDAYRPEEYVVVEVSGLPGGHVIGDVSKGLPFRESSVDEVVCVHVLEHIRDLKVAMRELHRVLRPGGVLRVWVPHCFSPIAFGDSSHVRFFTFETLSQFGQQSSGSYYYDFHFEDVQSRLQIFRRWYAPRPWDRLLEQAVNCDQRRGERLLKILPYKEWEVYCRLRKASRNAGSLT